MRPNAFAILSVLLCFVAACLPPFQNVQCIEDSNCDLFPGGLCHQNSATGNKWCMYPDPACPDGYRYSDLSGDDVSATCVADLGEAPPIVENGQPADLVLGQELFTTMDANHGGRSARSLYFPRGVTVDEDGRLWVFDAGNARALMWNPVPPASFAPAALVVGASDFTTLGDSCPPASITPGHQLAVKGGKLLIPYRGCNRVLIWNPGPVTQGAPASTVLGQASFTEITKGNGASELFGPSAVWTDGTRVALADSDNHRVLIWSSFPTTNKQPADIVLGQPGFGTSGASIPPTGATMNYPGFVYSDGVRLFVADSSNHRVLVWRSLPTTHGQPADFAIGQPDLASNGSGRGASQLNFPRGVTTAGDHLFVVDEGNNRVLVFSPIPTASGTPASFVLGQPSFETTDAGTTQLSLNRPASVAVGGNKLYVTDQFNHRVLRFDLKL